MVFIVVLLSVRDSVLVIMAWMVGGGKWIFVREAERRPNGRLSELGMMSLYFDRDD